MDVEALYPSLNLDGILEVVVELVEETEMEFENVDLKEVAKYFYITVPKKELEEKGLTRYLPQRTVELEGTAKGSQSVAYLDTGTYISSIGSVKVTKDKWMWSQWEEPTGRDRKLMLALLLREQVRVMFENHLYTFGGNLYTQKDGGPIGLKLTETAARGVIGRFNRHSRFTACIKYIQ